MQVDKGVITKIAKAKGNETIDSPILKIWCKKSKVEEMVFLNTTTGLNDTILKDIPGERCMF